MSRCFVCRLSGRYRSSLSELDGVLDVPVLRLQFMCDRQLRYRAGIVAGLRQDQAQVFVKQRTNGAIAARLEAPESSPASGGGRWSSKRKLSVILELLRGADLESTSRKHRVTIATLTEWRGRLLTGGEAGRAKADRDRWSSGGAAEVRDATTNVR